MSKTVSAKIPNNQHEELRERCNQLGCSINEFIENSIDMGLNGTSEFQFDPEESEIEPKSEEIENESDPKILSNLDVNLGKVYDEDGNIVGTIGKNS